MKQRETGADLMRVIATAMVITLHVLGCGGIIYNAARDSAVYWIAWFVELCAYGAVNCFALISGYVMLNKSVKISSLVSLWLQTLCYSVLITGLFFLFKREAVDAKGLLKAVTPIFSGQYWYVSSYFALFFLMPFLNYIIHHMPKQTVHKLFVAVAVGVCIFDCILPGDPLCLGEGYSPAWLAVMYLVGAYIKKYDITNKISAKKSLLLAFVMIGLIFFSKVGISIVTQMLFKQPKFDDIFVKYSSLPVALSAVFLFICCLNVKVGEKSKKIINLIAPTTLGVYLIHAHPYVYEDMLRDAFRFLITQNVAVMVLIVFLAVILIFAICAGIEWARIWLFQVLQVKKLGRFLERKIDKIV